MSAVSDKLKANFQDRLNGEPESGTIPELDGLKVYWKPLTGRQQKLIQKQSEKSTTEGVCMHVKTRALDENGAPIFGGEGVVGMMNDYAFESILAIFSKMTEIDLSAEDIEKN